MRLINADEIMELYANEDNLNIDDCSVPISIIRQNILDMPTVNPYEWISVKDRVPESTETVLALCKDGGMFVGKHTSWGRWQIWTAMKSTKIVNRTVTHWMPLPPPPTEKEN